MLRKNWKTYALFLIITLGTGALAGLLTRDATQIYNQVIVKPPLSPPAILFPVVWTVLYALMGISGARIWLAPDRPDRKRGLNLFVAQLVVNFFWSLLFFNAMVFGIAFIWLLLLWGLILWMILSFWKTDRLAALLQIPYLLWVTFAGYLNFAVWQLNG